MTIKTPLFNAQAMADKVVLVTGASSGLGAHFARVLAAAGARVIVAARRVQRLEELVAQINEAGGEATAVALDVAEHESVERAVNAALRIYGPIDCLVNNAGVAASKRFTEINEEDWQFVLETNLTGAWRVARAVTAQMLAHGISGSIVNTASILGLRVGFGASAYAVSKAGVVQLTKAMALELARKGIRVNALCPGYFETEMNRDYFDTEKGQQYIQQTPAQRLGNMSELDGPLLLLCSDAGSFINGVALPVDGGHMISSL